MYSVPSRKLSTENPCVARLGGSPASHLSACRAHTSVTAPYLTSRPLPACALYPTAFNSTAIQYAPLQVLADAAPDWWDLPHAPDRDRGAS
ncbi:hypothetical protein A0H81_04524 [Grifola frondosa]|uniref:Uncharacterized protein n=1 Tax=Grifola frondosa TaxID=5627 RepID=A0A1C7MJK8_GRIFR|nr:hypothetical protein A0H81_04524 [Grifola frondosa]